MRRAGEGARHSGAQPQTSIEYLQRLSRFYKFVLIYPRRMLTHLSSTSLLTIMTSFLAVAMTVMKPATASADVPSEYEQKASLMCGLLRNVDWPLRKLRQPNAPFVIGVIGADSISDFLREDLQGRRVKDRPLQIRRIATLQEIAICHVLFVSDSERDRLRTILSEARREGVLTVGESDNFLSAGGVIQFAMMGGRVTYLVSQANADRESLKLNGFVLRFSKPQSYLAPREGEQSPRRYTRADRE